MMKLLFIGAHTDDIELSCGATISKMKQAGHEITCIALSFCGRNELCKEYSDAMKSLEVDYTAQNEFPVRRFSNYRQEILEYLIYLREQHNPDQVITHSACDRHQDHSVVGAESLRAFRDMSLLTFTAPINRIAGNENYFISINRNQLIQKVEAVKCYTSQANRVYCDPEIIWSTARLAGIRAGVEYAEGFEVIKMIN